MDNNVTEYAKKKIEQIVLIQKDLDRIKKYECWEKNEFLTRLPEWM